jgi:predicted nucleic acid-binding protein
MAIETVVDSSVIVALVTPEEHSDWASKKLSEQDYLHILDLNYYEVANALKSKVHGKRFEGKDAVKSFTEAVELMNLYAIHNFSEIVADAISLALERDITVYDAAFLSLADKLHVRLLTLDVKLRDKVKGTRYYSIVDCPGK